MASYAAKKNMNFIKKSSKFQTGFWSTLWIWYDFIWFDDKMMIPSQLLTSYSNQLNFVYHISRDFASNKKQWLKRTTFSNQDDHQAITLFGSEHFISHLLCFRSCSIRNMPISLPRREAVTRTRDHPSQAPGVKSFVLIAQTVWSI